MTFLDYVLLDKMPPSQLRRHLLGRAVFTAAIIAWVLLT